MSPCLDFFFTKRMIPLASLEILMLSLRLQAFRWPWQQSVFLGVPTQSPLRHSKSPVLPEKEAKRLNLIRFTSYDTNHRPTSHKVVIPKHPPTTFCKGPKKRRPAYQLGTAIFSKYIYKYTIRTITLGTSIIQGLLPGSKTFIPKKEMSSKLTQPKLDLTWNYPKKQRFCSVLKYPARHSNGHKDPDALDHVDGRFVAAEWIKWRIHEGYWIREKLVPMTFSKKRLAGL